MRITRGWLFAGAILCFLLFLSFEAEGGREGDTTRTELRVGVPGSPWLTFLRIETERSASLPGGGWEGGWSDSTRWNVAFLSWSWLVLAAGTLLYYRAAKRREEPPPSPAPPPGPPPDGPSAADGFR